MDGMTERSKVVVLLPRCKGCGICIEVCPENVLAFSGQFNSKGYEYVELKDAGLCKSCAVCALMCPEIALHIYR